MTPVRRTLLLASLALMPLPALAQPEGRGQGGGRGGGNGNSGRGNQGGNGNSGRGNQGGNGRDNDRGPPGRGGGHGGSLGSSDLGIVHNWLGLNPGFTAQPLPPGMRNRLAQGKPLPPGIAKRSLPPDLLRLLPVRPGYEYAMIGTSLVLLGAGGVVASILSDALRR